jgi:hypothetical protein
MLRLAADENFNHHIVRGLLRRKMDFVSAKLMCYHLDTRTQRSA